MSEPYIPVLISCESEDAGIARNVWTVLREAVIAATVFERQPERNEWPIDFRYQIERCAVFVPILSKHNWYRQRAAWRLVDELVTTNGGPRIVTVYVDRAMTELTMPLPNSFRKERYFLAEDFDRHPKENWEFTNLVASLIAGTAVPESESRQLPEATAADAMASPPPVAASGKPSLPTLDSPAEPPPPTVGHELPSWLDSGAQSPAMYAARREVAYSALERQSDNSALGGVYPVWFATNRKSKIFGRAGFSSGRANRLALGRVNVLVPKTHRFGETGNPFWKRLFRLDLRDDHLRIQSLLTLGHDAFYTEMGDVMKAARENSGLATALVFLHGFNVTFEEAAIRAAQIGFDLKVQGATAFFSWPSFGKVSKYAADEASIEASEPYITDFLIDFAANCNADKVHLIAHSMGNRGLLRSLQRVAARAEDASKLKFEQLILAAPDVDRDVFIELAKSFDRHCKRTTLYASGHDLPVYVSDRLHSFPRAGYIPPYTVVSGIDTIVVPNFKLDLLGHSYFAQAEALLHDIFDLMQRDADPGQRQRIEPASEGSQTFWRLRR
jgi:esterase/lipase superfamily enzyme